MAGRDREEDKMEINLSDDSGDDQNMNDDIGSDGEAPHNLGQQINQKDFKNKNMFSIFFPFNIILCFSALSMISFSILS